MAVFEEKDTSILPIMSCSRKTFFDIFQKIKIFVFFYISPSFGVSKMGSFISQLQAIVEIWRDEVDTLYALFRKFE